MTRRAIWLAIGLLIAWLAVSAMPVSVAGSQDVGAREGGPTAWQWQPYSQGLPTCAMVMAVAAPPTDPGLIYAATYEPSGLWRSDDRGRLWEMDDEGLEGRPVYALHWDTARRQWWAGARDGLYTRSDADAPWQAARLGEHTVYAIAEDEKGRLYVATEDGLFRSEDADTWEAMPISDSQTGMAILALDVSPDGRTFMAGTAGRGLWISGNGGAAWSPAPDPATEAGKTLAQAYVSAVLLDASPDGAAYVSTPERTYRSADGGVT